MKIVIMEPLGIGLEKVQNLMASLQTAGHQVVYYESKELDQEKLLARVRDAEIIMLANQPLSAKIIEGCPKLRMLSVAFTGVDHISLQACRERNIMVCNAAGYSTNAVAELTFGLAIALIRNIVPCDERTRSAGTKDGLVGFELCGKTFGIVGTGAIGTKVAHIAQAFGCRVIAYSRTPKKALQDAGVVYLPLEQLLAQADFVSLHVPLTEATKNLIDAEAIGKMKRSAVLLNTARGGVVDSEALAEALNSGRLAGAGIDVFENEPPILSTHPLCQAKNTVLTPHVAFASREALEVRAEIVFKNIEQWLAGAPQNMVIC